MMKEDEFFYCKSENSRTINHTGRFDNIFNNVNFAFVSLNLRTTGTNRFSFIFNNKMMTLIKHRHILILKNTGHRKDFFAFQQQLV